MSSGNPSLFNSRWTMSGNRAIFHMVRTRNGKRESSWRKQSPKPVDMRGFTPALPSIPHTGG
ncbi:hypothetical protein OJF2_74710 [Aquisphaera giovannonii]|uniref:Uncharacterized protein n=1 Tax=Aquisphaera giovannonii TaxID=406548 RepID=A0A5B9WFU3_9BACT|nr:hypothetical protein OJF2_74710 [Aquisphaera giovannonii]